MVGQRAATAPHGEALHFITVFTRRLQSDTMLIPPFPQGAQCRNSSRETGRPWTVRDSSSPGAGSVLVRLKRSTGDEAAEPPRRHVSRAQLLRIHYQYLGP